MVELGKACIVYTYDADSCNTEMHKIVKLLHTVLIDYLAINKIIQRSNILTYVKITCTKRKLVHIRCCTEANIAFKLATERYGGGGGGQNENKSLYKHDPSTYVNFDPINNSL